MHEEDEDLEEEVPDALEEERKTRRAAALPDPVTYVDEAFRTGGWLSRSFTSYQPRSGQVQLANRIAKALFDGVHLVAEGPTGTGKSVAYAIPAIYHAAATKRPVVIVTANIALQEQLITKDLPMLQKVLPWEFSFSLIKGRGNYLCQNAASQVQGDLTMGKLRSLKFEEQEEARQILEWAKSTTEGDVSELKTEPSPRVWSRFSVSGEDCLGSKCKYRNDCFSQKARTAIRTVDVIVTNYHFLFASLAARKLLPPYQTLIFDEAHKMVDIARDFFGARVSEFSVRYALSSLPQEYVSAGPGRRPLRARLEHASSEFFQQLYDWGRSPAYNIRLRATPPVAFEPLLECLLEAASYTAKAMKNVVDQHERAVLDLARKRFERIHSTLVKSLFLPVEDLLEPHQTSDNEDEYVHYLDFNHERGAVAICSKKFRVAEDLAQALFDQKTVVAVSATLSVNGSFDHLIEESGLPPERTRTFEAETPFSWKDQVTLVIPGRFPEPNSEFFPRALASGVIEVVKMARGRTLGLFTSWKSLKLVREALLAENLPYRILSQGDAPKTRLVEEFMRDRSSVLLGVESLWQGIDVPGESLSCVVIDKLPFPHLHDPILSALDDAGERGFQTYSIPRAIIALKQGFGRLIRTTTDKGVVVIFDNRINSKGYGKLFLRSLPDIPRSSLLDTVEEVLGEPTCS